MKKLNTIFFLLLLFMQKICFSISSSEYGSSFTPGTVKISPKAKEALPLQAMHPDIIIANPDMPHSSDPYASIEKPCPDQPVCRDFNGNLPSGAAENCPETCFAVREAPCETESGGTTCLSPKRYKYVKNAICPPGYGASHVYNMGPEIVWSNDPPMIPPPITTAQWNNIKNKGYICSHATQGIVVRYCRDDPMYFTAQECPTNDGRCGYYENNPNRYISDMVFVEDVLVQVISKYKYPVCRDTCWTRTCVLTPYDYSSEYTYVKIQCKPPVGFYETTNQVPTALICTRIQALWRQD